MYLPKMTPVESSKIKAVGFDPVSETLYVQFKTDNSYWSYRKVTQEDYNDMMASESIGVFHGRLARGAKKVTRLLDPDQAKEIN